MVITTVCPGSSVGEGVSSTWVCDAVGLGVGVGVLDAVGESSASGSAPSSPQAERARVRAVAASRAGQERMAARYGPLR